MQEISEVKLRKKYLYGNDMKGVGWANGLCQKITREQKRAHSMGGTPGRTMASLSDPVVPLGIPFGEIPTYTEIFYSRSMAHFVIQGALTSET
jgi:hypothetical protein